MSEPETLVAVNLTDQVPFVNTSEGFWFVGVPAKFAQLTPPFEDFSQSQEVGVLVEVSVNTTVNEAGPFKGVPVKLATGVGISGTQEFLLVQDVGHVHMNVVRCVRSRRQGKHRVHGMASRRRDRPAVCRHCRGPQDRRGPTPVGIS